MTENKEELFFDALHKQIKIELDKSYDPREGTQYDYLGLSEQALALAQAGILLGGLASAPFTFGLGLAGAGSVIVVIRAGRLIVEHYQASQPPAVLPEHQLANPNVLTQKRNLRRLAFEVLLHQAGQIIFTRYYYGLHETVLDNANIRKLVQVIVPRMMKKLCAELAQDPLNLPNPENLADYLLISIHRSGLLTTDEIALKPSPHSSPMRLAAMPAEEEIKKYLALQCWLSFDDTSVEIKGTEPSYLRSLWDTKSTRHDYGYITIPRSKPFPVTAIDTTRLITLPIPEAEKNSVITKSLFPQLITRTDIDEYESSFLTDTVKRSFHQFLLDKYNRPTKALFRGDFHDLTLAGDYSNVDFYECKLINCNGSNGIFFNANFNKSTLIRFTTNSKTNLQSITAKGSIWNGEISPNEAHTILYADISHGDFSGSTWTHYKISTTASQMGSIWLWATLDTNMLVSDTETFINRLNDEHTAREQQAKRIDDLEQQYKTVENLVRTNATEAHTAITALRNSLSDLRTDLAALQQQQLIEIDRQLTMLTANLGANTQGLAVITARLDQHIREQDKHNQIVDKQLDHLTQSQDVLYLTSLYCSYWVYTAIYRTKKSTYIPLYVKSHHATPAEPHQPLNEMLQQAQLDDTKYVLIHAPTNAGQTFSVTVYGESINAVHHKPDSPVFITINTTKIRDKEPNILATLFTEYVYRNANPSILTEIKKYPFIIHLSKLDTSGIPPHKLIKDCESFSADWPNVKFFFSGLSAYILAVRTHIDHYMMPIRYVDYTLQFLNQTQIEVFFNQFSREKLATPCRHLEERGIINIPSLARTPLMLTIMVGVLFGSTNPSNQPMQEIDFYEKSWKALYERIQFRLPEPYQSNEYEFMDLMYKFAKLMFKDNTDFVIYKRADTLASSRKDLFLRDLFETKLGACSPLCVTEIEADIFRISFSHETLGYYLMAKILVDTLFEPNFTNKTFDHTWNKHYLTETPGILQFLVQLLQKYPDSEPEHSSVQIMRQGSESPGTPREPDSDDEEIVTPSKSIAEQRLLDMTYLTHTSNSKKTHYKIAASNALTVLCKWGRDLFGRDLSQRILHHADATNGLLAYTNHDGTDYKGTCFHNALLFSARMSNTDLREARFLGSAHFLEMGSAPQIFFVYPSLTETILVYPLPPNDYFRMYQIAIVKIVNGSTQLLHCWPAQEQDISTIDITSNGNAIQIATAGVGGTTHVWKIDSNAPINPEKIAKFVSFKYKHSVNIVTWGPTGNILATGDKNGYVRTWSLTTNTRKLKSAKHNAAIRTMVWDKTNDLLIATEGGSSLSIWRNAEGLHGQQTQLHDRWLIQLTDGSPEIKVHSLVFSNDKALLAVGCADGRIILLDCATREVKLILNQHKDSVTSMVWHQHLITASKDRTVRVWHSDIHHGTVFEHDHAVGKVDVLPNGHIISGVDPDCTRMYFWDPKQIKSKSNPDPLGIISCMAARPTSIHPYVAIGDAGGAVVLYPIQDMEQPDAPYPTIVARHLTGTVQSLAWSWDGQYLAAIIQDHTLVIHNIETLSTPPVTKQVPGDASALFNHMAWVQDNSGVPHLIIGCSDGALITYSSQDNFDSPNQLLSFFHLESPILSLATHKDSPYIAIAENQSIHLMNPSTEKTITHTYTSQQRPKILQWSSDGSILLLIDEAHHVSLWTVEDEKLTLSATFYERDTEIRCALWKDNWLILGLANSREMIYWDMDTGLRTTPKRFPLRAKFLSESPHEDTILVARTTGIYFFTAAILNLDPEDRNTRFKLQRLKAGICAEAADLHGAQNVSISTQKYLHANGVRNVGSRVTLFRQASFDASTSSAAVSTLPPLASDSDRRHLVSAVPRTSLRFFSTQTNDDLHTIDPQIRSSLEAKEDFAAQVS